MRVFLPQHGPDYRPYNDPNTAGADAGEARRRLGRTVGLQMSTRQEAQMLEAVVAGAIGLGAASFLLVGAVIGWFVRVPTGVVAGVMAFGAGALISTLAFELVGEAHAVGGLAPTLGGFLTGAIIYVLADLALAQRGAREPRVGVVDRAGRVGEHPDSGGGRCVKHSGRPLERCRHEA